MDTQWYYDLAKILIQIDHVCDSDYIQFNLVAKLKYSFIVRLVGLIHFQLVLRQFQTKEKQSHYQTGIENNIEKYFFTKIVLLR